METKTICRLGGFVLGGFLLLGPARAALADEPATPEQAAAMAQTAQEQADQYRQLGGVAYKTGLVQRSEAEANRYASQADEMSAPSGPVTSPEAQAAQEQADQYRQLGGVAYKTGLVQRAEADANRYSSTEETSAPSVTVSSPEAEHYGQLAEDYKQMGGVGYKTGLVQRAEADQRRAQEEAAAAAVTPPPKGPSDWVDPWGPACDQSKNFWSEPPAGCHPK